MMNRPSNSPIQHCHPLGLSTVVFLFLATLWLPISARAQDDDPGAASTETQADPEAPLSGGTKKFDTLAADPTATLVELQTRLRPLDRTELEFKLAGWMALLKAKIVEVGEAGIEVNQLRQAEGEEAPEVESLAKQLVALSVEEAGLHERVGTVIAALRKKGGDVTEAEQYLDAVSGIDAGADSATKWAAAIAAVKTWLGKPDGGQKFLRRIGLALLVLLVFWILSKYTGRVVRRALSRRESLSTLLINFATRIAGGVTLAVGALIALSLLGVPIAPLLAAMGAGGFILGFALQETLGNFASGLLIMIYRPFDVDDYISIAGAEGTVNELGLVSTTLLSIDNKVLIVPNKAAWGGTITNFTGRDVRRVDLVFGIGYSDDIPTAISILKELASDHELVLAEPELSVEVIALADSSVNLSCRPWTKTEDYWRVYWDLNQQVKLRFDKEGISIPFPQQDVHIQNPPPAEENSA
jgi:small conductance mechanosensitive channel